MTESRKELYSYEVSQWLLQGDPSIRWQVKRDLLNEDEKHVEDERSLIATTGWGKKLLTYQDSTGFWGGGLYSPKWTSTTYTMLLLQRLGLAPQHPQALRACSLLLDRGFYDDGGINYWKRYKHSETCVTGMFLSILCYFRLSDTRIHTLTEHLLKQQMPDGGWNCQSYRGATHSSFHTTISVLEGLYEYSIMHENQNGRIVEAQSRGREFLLVHKLFRSHRTGKVVSPAMTRFSFPPRWRYDILKALDYFQIVKAPRDERLTEAISIVEKRRCSDGRWMLQNRHPGKTYFELEKVCEASRWNTLRALRVLRWWKSKN